MASTYQLLDEEVVGDEADPKPADLSGMEAGVPRTASTTSTTVAKDSAMAPANLAAAAVSWGVCSIGMTLLNKRAIDKTGAPLGVVVLQMLVTVLVALSQYRWLHFGQGRPHPAYRTAHRARTATAHGHAQPAIRTAREHACKTMRRAVTRRHPAVGEHRARALHVHDGLQHARAQVCLGRRVVVRNLGPLVTLVMEVALHKPDNLTCNARTAGPTVAIAAGVWMYEANDMMWSERGFFLLMANLGFACAYTLGVRHLLHVSEVDVSRTVLVLLNNSIGAGLTVIAVSFSTPGEWHTLYHALWHVRGAATYTLASCAVGCAISYCGLWLQSLITATSFMVLGSVAKMAVVLWGMLFLHDAAGPLAIFGALLSMGGGFAYAHKGDCGPRAEASCIPTKSATPGLK